MRPELQQAIDRLEADEFCGADVRTLIAELRRLDRPKAAKGEPRPKAERPRDLIMDTFALIEGMNLKEVGPSNWSRYAKCKKELLIICPSPTPEEMRRRAAAYKKDWPGASLTADALIKWWPKYSHESKNQAEITLGENLR